MKMVNLKTLFLKTDPQTLDDIYAKLITLNLDPKTKILSEEMVVPLSELNTMINEGGVFPSNFQIGPQGTPAINQRMLGAEIIENADSVVRVVKPITKMTLTYIFNLLQDSGCSFVFEPYMYKDITGDESFESFNPSLEGLTVPFKNLIISGKKFNIVFSVVVPGTVNHNGTLVDTNRVYPFKVIKAGEPMFDSIKIIVQDNSPIKNLLENTATKINDNMYELELKRFQSFNDSYIPTVNDLYAINYVIQEARTKVKSLKFVKDILSNYLQITGALPPQEEWYRGDKVMLDTLSDEGLPILETYISGSKQQDSVDALLDKLGDVGSKLRKIIQDVIINELNDELYDYVEPKLSAFSESLINRNDLTPNQKEIIKALNEYSLFKGSLPDKWKAVLREYYRLTYELNSLEIKYLDVRFGLLTVMDSEVIDFNDYVNLGMGVQKTGRKSSITFTSSLFNDGQVLVRRTYVQSNKGSTPLSEWFNGYFSEKEEQSSNPTNNKEQTISTDFRKVDNTSDNVN